MTIAAPGGITPPLQYATYFNRHYLTRGIALHRSLLRHSPAFTLWVLCLDRETEETLGRLGLPGVRPVPVADLERADPALRAVKTSRETLEYYWTCGPAFLRWLLDHHGWPALTYLDADLFFFSSPAPLYEELGAGSILIVEQRHSPGEGRGGRFNVGLLVFRATEAARACIERWRAQCLEWCFDRFEADRHGDQKYLDEWPARFPGVHVARHPGAGVAPWNAGRLPIVHTAGRVLVGTDPLIFCHFGRVRRVNRWVYEMHDSAFHRAPAPWVVRRHLYVPYVRELRAAERLIRAAGGTVARGTVRTETDGERARRSRAAGVSRLRLARYQRFILGAGPFVL